MNGGCGVGVGVDGGGDGSARVGGVHRPYAARAKNRLRRHLVRLQLSTGRDRPRLFHRRGAFETALFVDTDGACTDNHFGVRNANRVKTDVTTKEKKLRVYL